MYCLFIYMSVHLFYFICYICGVEGNMVEKEMENMFFDNHYLCLSLRISCSFILSICCIRCVEGNVVEKEMEKVFFDNYYRCFSLRIYYFFRGKVWCEVRRLFQHIFR